MSRLGRVYETAVILIFIAICAAIVYICTATAELPKEIPAFTSQGEREAYYALAKYHAGTGRFGQPKFLVTWQDKQGVWWFKREHKGDICRFQYPTNKR